MTILSRSDRSLAIEGHAALARFQLAPDIIYLNHGGYGAVPRTVSAAQDRWRAQIEANPTGFFVDVLPDALRRAAQTAAAQFGGAAKDWVFVENATSAVSGVLSSFPLRADDEILTTSHGYGAVLKAMGVTAQRRGAHCRVAELPAIVGSEDEIVDAIARAFTPRTRLLIVDHITSPTAIVFPVARIAAAARERGIAVLVDGAHAVGQVDVDVEAIGADWYTGNAHKWLFAPKGCGVLWTAPRRQAETLPPVLSHGVRDGYTAAFDWIGTRDVTPWLCLVDAAKEHSLLGGIDLMARNRRLASEGAGIVAKTLGQPVTAPAALRAAMTTIRLAETAPDDAQCQAFRHALFEKTSVVAPVFGFAGQLWLRISAQIYNETDDYRRLAAVLPALLKQAKLA